MSHSVILVPAFPQSGLVDQWLPSRAKQGCSSTLSSFLAANHLDNAVQPVPRRPLHLCIACPSVSCHLRDTGRSASLRPQAMNSSVDALARARTTVALCLPYLPGVGIYEERHRLELSSSSPISKHSPYSHIFHPPGERQPPLSSSTIQ
jgi:hypothetical protein